MANLHNISANPHWNLVFNLLLDDAISEVQSNGPNSFFLKKSGKRMHISAIQLETDEAYSATIEPGLVPHITTWVPFDEHGYIFEGPLRYTAGGREIRARCHIILPPAADVPQVTIAKKSTSLATLDAIAAKGSMATEMLSFVKAAAAGDMTVVFSGGTGAGKALHKDTLLPTPFGFRSVDSLTVGDVLFDETGARTTISKKYCPLDPSSYELRFKNNESVRASAGHLWLVTLLNKKTSSADQKQAVMTTEELVSYGVVSPKGKLRFAIEALSNAVDYDEQELPIDPYALGAWIGEGALNSGKISSAAVELNEKISSSYPLELTSVEYDPNQTNSFYSWTYEGLTSLLQANGLLNNKHIPEVYKISSVDQRKALLAGLVDAHGSVDPRGRCNFDFANFKVVKAAREIALSLGWVVTPITASNNPSGKAQSDRILSYNFSFHADELPLQSPDKLERLAKQNKLTDSQRRKKQRQYITEIVPIDDNPEDYFCFEVDSPSHLFLCSESFIPTHNTTFLEAFTKELPLETRMGVAEDTPELALIHPNVVYQHSNPWRPGMDEKDVATLSWVVSQFNRQRTDKLIIGETRGKEFADFLIAANSGMEGSLTTIHANDPVRALEKMTNFASKGGGLQPIRSINTDIANSIDLIIQLAYFKGDSRYRVTAIQEITNTIGSTESATITTNRIYTYNPSNDTWTKEANMTDILRRKFAQNGVNIDHLLHSKPGTILYPNGGGAEETRSGLPVRRL